MNLNLPYPNPKRIKGHPILTGVSLGSCKIKFLCYTALGIQYSHTGELMLTINNLSFNYPHYESLFNELNLRLTPGNIYGLLGKNGAGKTTLLKIICGLLFPISGECQYQGNDTKGRSPLFLEELFFIPEEFYVPQVTAQQYIKFYAPFYKKFDQKQFEQSANEFELPINKKLSTLSYGQKKKFLIAFGLATNASLLILDEPTNGLDIASKSKFRKLIASSITEDKIVIVSTHQVRDMETLIDPIVILDDGKIIFNEPIHEVAKKLSITEEHEKPDPRTTLYSEKSLHGYTTVTPNDSGFEGDINLEILFNTVLSNKQFIQKIFNKEANHE